MACLPCVTDTLWAAASFSTLLYSTYQQIIIGLYLTGKYGLFTLCYCHIMSSSILFYTIVWYLPTDYHWTLLDREVWPVYPVLLSHYEQQHPFLHYCIVLTNRLSLDSTWQGSMACLPCVTDTLWAAASFSTLLYSTYQQIIIGLYLTGKYGLFILCYCHIMSSSILFYTIVWYLPTDYHWTLLDREVWPVCPVLLSHYEQQHPFLHYCMVLTNRLSLDSTWQGSMACLPCVTVTLWAAASFSTLLYGTYQQIIIGLYLTGKYGLFTLCYCHIMSSSILFYTIV